MSKAEAMLKLLSPETRRRVIENVYTVGEARRAIQAARQEDRAFSKVNSNIPWGMVLDIYEGALKAREDSEVFVRPATPNRDGLTLANILLDCGGPHG